MAVYPLDRHLDTPLCIVLVLGETSLQCPRNSEIDWIFSCPTPAPCALSSEPRFPWCWHKTLYVPRLCRKDLFRIQLWIITVRETEFSQGPACEDPLETERPSWFIHDSQENPSWIDSHSHDWAVELSCCELQTGFDLIRQMCSSFKDERAETCRLKPWQQLWRVSYILQVISGYSEWKNAMQMKLWLPTIPNPPTRGGVHSLLFLCSIQNFVPNFAPKLFHPPNLKIQNPKSPKSNIQNPQNPKSKIPKTPKIQNSKSPNLGRWGFHIKICYITVQNPRSKIPTIQNPTSPKSKIPKIQNPKSPRSKIRNPKFPNPKSKIPQIQNPKSPESKIQNPQNLDFGDFGFWIAPNFGVSQGILDLLQNPKSPKSKTQNPQDPKSPKSKLQNPKSPKSKIQNPQNPKSKIPRETPKCVGGFT